MSFLITVFSFLLAIIILVGIHEFGHFYVARKFGVKVLKFSIGFGKALWSYKSNISGTEYALCAIPLGGFVKMLDEREGEVDKSELDLAFNNKSLGARASIVAAGPVFNIVFAVVVYWLVLMIGAEQVKPILGDIAPDSIAEQSGLKKGDEILSVNKQAIRSWSEMYEHLMQLAVDDLPINLEVRSFAGNIDYRHITTAGFNENPGKWFKQLGFMPYMPPAPVVISQVVAASPAFYAGLQAGETISKIDNVKIDDWYQLVKIVQANAGNKLEFVIVDSAGQERYVPITPRPEITKEEKTNGKIGISPQIMQIPAEMLVTVQYNALSALPKALQKTWDISRLTVRMIWKMLTGQTSFVENVGGPISIAKIAGGSFSAGIVSFLGFLGLLSVSLGILNLLPVPVLDGGHLLFYLIELVKGSPVSEAFELFFQKIGMALLLTLMLFAIYIDMMRL